MSNLRFRCLVDNDFCDIAPFEPYIEKGSSDMGLALIAFDESELDTIKNLLKEAQLEDSDGYLYILSQGSVEKKGKMSHSVMKAYRYYKRYKKKQNRAAAHIEKELSHSGDGIRKVSGGRFSAYKYKALPHISLTTLYQIFTTPFTIHTSCAVSLPVRTVL